MQRALGFVLVVTAALLILANVYLFHILRILEATPREPFKWVYEVIAIEDLEWGTPKTEQLWELGAEIVTCRRAGGGAGDKPLYECIIRRPD